MKIYVVRHGEASGNHPEAPLSALGMQQSIQVAAFLAKEHDPAVIRVISSPLLRARQTADEICRAINGVSYKADVRLTELELGNTTNQPRDIWNQLQELFEHKEFAFQGGESISMVVNRVSSLLNELNEGDDDNSVILVTHRVTMTLLLSEFDRGIGFEQCKTMNNVDVYLVTAVNNGSQVERIWRMP
ncbi:histidine phosphatase family protein [Lysinibacillus sphaericus]|uniref:Phosphoglycerate mutase n=1 Tax=Lysinibacillus sphaericus OT4b.31 TaxID=1285586 RepID=R7Z7R1_LYSSH|nr:histidine phosphatase family protein [Lysinibacillus sphaericus]EON70133.1 phosphoglycerate mutase [Lysinibacillus sphaericus OT4b.31]